MTGVSGVMVRMVGRRVLVEQSVGITSAAAAGDRCSPGGERIDRATAADSRANRATGDMGVTMRMVSLGRVQAWGSGAGRAWSAGGGAGRAAAVALAGLMMRIVKRGARRARAVRDGVLGVQVWCRLVGAGRWACDEHGGVMVVVVVEAVV